SSLRVEKRLSGDQRAAWRRYHGFELPSVKTGMGPTTTKEAPCESAKTYRNSGASTKVTVASSLMSTCSEGPAVSLKGSPTVSPTTAALCASDRLPPYAPVSIYFLALSHAPPPLFIRM